jgi:electron transfer flavoprotein alpha subunit
MSPAKGVWVLIEQHGEELQDGSLELVGEGSKIAEKLNEELTAVTLGNIPGEQVEHLAHHGAKRIICIENPALSQYSVENYSLILADVIQQQSPEIILSVHSINGSDLACRVAGLLGTGMVTACDRVDVSGEKLLVQVKPVYRGKAAATFCCQEGRPQMATLNLDAMELKTPDTRLTAEVVNLQSLLEPDLRKTEVVGFIPGNPKLMDLTEAEIVVAGGKGLGSKDNFKLVHELADVLGGSVGASRVAVDDEWIARERQIGLTGKTVRPKLFIACGISGAIQHTMGMKDSKVIIAINIDRNAPIFKIADVGVIGDVLQVMPVLTAQIREVMQQNPKPSIDEVVDAVADASNQ